jgi:uncharacterized protein YaaR (DUF327 family)
MGNNKSKEFIESLEAFAEEYITECLENTKSVISNNGKEFLVPDRHIPTVAFFLNIWLPRKAGDTIVRNTYYTWLKSEDSLKKDTIKSIDDKFNALAGDIVANEGKGIFYAKNKLGWSDRIDTNTRTNITLLNIDPLADIPTTIEIPAKETKKLKE